VAALLARGAVPILIGGGHDLTFAALAALARHAGGPIGGVNIDAHLDVRPVRDGVITSGTPFRRAIESDGLPPGETPFGPFLDATHFVVLGPHGNRNARAHIAWLRERGGRLLPLADARRMGAAAAMTTALAWAAGSGPLYVSLDIDSAAQASAPGCSAPGADGFGPEDLLTFAFLAGREPAVAAFDVMEVNPRFDHDDRTAALAAAALVRFLFGLAARTAARPLAPPAAPGRQAAADG
jgi:arginase family enzyme